MLFTYLFISLLIYFLIYYLYTYLLSFCFISQNEEDAFILKSLREYTMEKVESGENVDEDEWNMIILLALFGWQKR